MLQTVVKWCIQFFHQYLCMFCIEKESSNSFCLLLMLNFVESLTDEKEFWYTLSLKSLQSKYNIKFFKKKNLEDISLFMKPMISVLDFW